jgi:hypothetical protein
MSITRETIAMLQIFTACKVHCEVAAVAVITSFVLVQVQVNIVARGVQADLLVFDAKLEMSSDDYGGPGSIPAM